MRSIQAVKLGILLSMAISSSAMAQSSQAIVPGVAQVSNTSGNNSGARVQKTLPSAQQLIDEGIKAAKASNKTVFVFFGNNGCKWCHVLKKFLYSPEVGSIIAAHYVLVPITAHSRLANPGADSMMRTMDLGDGLPGFAFLDGSGKQIASSVIPPNGNDMGYPVKAGEIKLFTELIRKTAPRMTDADGTKINEYLTQAAKRLAYY
jgi:thioredoxin-related protein